MPARVASKSARVADWLAGAVRKTGSMLVLVADKPAPAADKPARAADMPALAADKPARALQLVLQADLVAQVLNHSKRWVSS